MLALTLEFLQRSLTVDCFTVGGLHNNSEKKTIATPIARRFNALVGL
jgi:hypothetical protein